MIVIEFVCLGMESMFEFRFVYWVVVWCVVLVVYFVVFGVWSVYYGILV